MKPAPVSRDADPESLPPVPSWITAGRAETLEDAAFTSGAALSHLQGVLGRDALPGALLRERLALRAAAACVGFSGRVERAGELRDALHLIRPGDRPGPAGEVYLCWRRAVERPVSVKALRRALPGIAPDRVAPWLGAGRGAPVAQTAFVLETVLAEMPRAHTAALILADAALARALGWSRVVPLLALGVTRRDLQKTGADLRLACHRAIAASAVAAIREAGDLTRRATRLRAVAPKLRAKGAGEAVTMFLTRDAVAPTALSSLRSDHAARRFCARLVELGAVRELTGRDTFRLYGV